ncbi:MAG: RNA-binding protein [Verrucomicrobiota bacterium JB023]|nr:RNA-binding protein [Verrucomicrobiota bacterium JB023]
MTIYLGNISLESTEKQIYQFLEPHGTICDLNYPTDSVTGKHRGFAFFTIPDQESAEEAISKIDGSELAGRTLKASKARVPDRPKPEIPVGFRRPGEVPFNRGRR